MRGEADASVPPSARHGGTARLACCSLRGRAQVGQGAPGPAELGPTGSTGLTPMRREEQMGVMGCAGGTSRELKLWLGLQQHRHGE